MELELSDEEIRAALAPYNSNIPPITKGTRPVLLRKIAQLRAASDGQDNDRGPLPASVSQEVPGDELPAKGAASDGQGKDRGPLLASVSQEVQGDELPAKGAASDGQAKDRARGPLPASVSQEVQGDAIHFKERLSKITVGKAEAVAKPSHIERANEFPSLTVPEKNKFRLLIENSDVDEFVKSVWENPRCLITQGDAPEVLKIGPRYNALHCAIRAGSLEVCKKLCEILEGDRFWSLVYPDDPIEVRNKRRDHLVDLYLNTCDKGLQETPLHFAAKYGHKDIVSFLLKLAVDTKAVNKHGETASDVACKNSSDAQCKRRIQDLLSAPAIYYIPVIRAADNTIHPRLSVPCTLQELEHQQQRPIADMRDAPIINSAMAGPMSPLKAESFYKEWRHSPSEADRKAARCVMRSDPDRGLERIGRRLAHQQRVGWKEYWGFLDRACDLSKPEGLQALEDYLAASTRVDPNVGNSEDLVEGMAELSLHTTPCTPKKKKSPGKFLTGSMPTKLDYDVLMAIAPEADMSSYQNVLKWYSIIKSFSEEERKRWPTPKRQSSRHTPQQQQQSEYPSPLVYSHPGPRQHFSNHTPQTRHFSSPLVHSSPATLTSHPIRVLFQD